MESLNSGRKSCSQALGISLPMLDVLLNRVENPIPHFRVGRKVLIPRAALEQWLLDEAERTAAKNGAV